MNRNIKNITTQEEMIARIESTTYQLIGNLWDITCKKAGKEAYIGTRGYDDTYILELGFVEYTPCGDGEYLQSYDRSNILRVNKEMRMELSMNTNRGFLLADFFKILYQTYSTTIKFKKRKEQDDK